MKIVWRKIIGPDVHGITTYEPGDKVKLKNPAPSYNIMGEIKDIKSNIFKPSPITPNINIHIDDEMIVEEIIPYDSRVFQSDDIYVVKHVNTGKIIKLQRVYLDIF